MFGGGGGGLNPGKMKQMMEQMGVDFEELDAQRVVIETPEETLVFDDADVNKIGARGQETYQVVGSPTVEEGAAAIESGDDGESDDGSDDGPEIPDEDVQIVAQRAGASEDAAREALRAADGDLAAAIERLQ